jgi:purine-cytosine permease-like protein
MSITAGIGWFAVNSVSGTFALQTLFGLPFLVALVIIVLAQVVVAFFGHNLVHQFERYAFIPLVVVFAIATVLILAKSNPGQAFNPKAPLSAGGELGAFILTAAAAFGYAAGWNPYASDYTRYLPRTSNRLMVGLWAGLGVFVSCAVLEIMGAALVTVAGTRWGPSDIPTDQFRHALPGVIAVLAMLCIALGAVSANVLNIYSGAMAFLTVGIRLPLRQRRALVAVVFGAIGFLVATTGNAAPGGKYEDFLLVISYWIAPWLGVVFTDYWMRRGDYGDESIFYDRRHANWVGPIAMVIGTVVSVYLFSAQALYTGPVALHVPQLGDLTFLVGFVLSAVSYYVLSLVTRRSTAAAGAASARQAG